MDGAGSSGFWNLQEFAEGLAHCTGVTRVYEKMRAGSDTRGRVVLGELSEPNVTFSDNGLRFRANLVEGQKSSFFFNQRDTRAQIRALSSGWRMLNLFGYTGGFSVYAGPGGAEHVTTVDFAKHAIEDAEVNWVMNGLQSQKHVGFAVDVFQFLEQVYANKDHWDLIVVDPPSFAKSSKHIDAPQESYCSLFTSALRVFDSGGIIALSSCSSHISTELFLEIWGTSLSKARRRGTILGVYGQPEDRPFPFVCKELQCLKFVI